MKLRILNFLFLLIAIAELWGEATGSKPVIYVFKPLIMISLIVLYRSSIKGPLGLFHKLIIIAFFFSWLGDIFLMLPGEKEHYFLLGLSSFLVTHVLYAVAFIYSVRADEKQGIIFRKPLTALPIIAYGISLIYLLYQDLGEMRLPVIVYAATILFMVLAALNRFSRVSSSSFFMVLLGAVLFMISDSMIAFDRFHPSFYPARTLIMLTYIVAQYYIAIGCLEQRADQNESIPIP